jgi:hypothetical protein
LTEQSGLLRHILRLTATRENFMRAYPQPSPGLRERDLFEGTVEYDRIY